MVILILEHACLSYASESRPTQDEALDEAYSRYCASGIHNELTEQFSAHPQEYSILQFTEFILTHTVTYTVHGPDQQLGGPDPIWEGRGPRLVDRGPQDRPGVDPGRRPYATVFKFFSCLVCTS